MPIGTNPANAAEVNNLAGYNLQQFLLIREKIIRDHDWLDGINLAEVYGFTPDDEAALKAAVGDVWGVVQPMSIVRVLKATGLGFG